jgi:hypothetical protein
MLTFWLRLRHFRNDKNDDDEIFVPNRSVAKVLKRNGHLIKIVQSLSEEHVLK